jgi:hypothetical protein
MVTEIHLTLALIFICLLSNALLIGAKFGLHQLRTTYQNRACFALMIIKTPAWRVDKGL